VVHAALREPWGFSTVSVQLQCAGTRRPWRRVYIHTQPCGGMTWDEATAARSSRVPADGNCIITPKRRWAGLDGHLAGDKCVYMHWSHARACPADAARFGGVFAEVNPIDGGAGARTAQALTDLSLEDAFSEVVKELWDENADVAASGVGMRRKGTHSTAPSEAGDGGGRSHHRSRRHRSQHRRSVSSSRSRSHSRDEHHHRRDKQRPSHARPSRHSRRSPADSERSHASAGAAKGDAPADDEVKSNRSQEELLLNIHELRTAVAAGDGELAARFAYENLRSLAGMSHQIQAAVEQSTALFDKRARRAELLLLKQCFMSWGSAQYDRKHKMERVVRRMGRLKTTQAWNVRIPRLSSLQSCALS
jgi:hypothetical protein